MTEQADAHVITALAERFQDAVNANKRTPRNAPIDDEVFVDMMFRMVRALEQRAIANPAVLTLVRALGARMDEVVNVAIAANAERYAADPMAGASMMECARTLGITKQSASERKARGRAAMASRIAAAGVVRFSERQREREMYIQPAQETSVVALADYFARRRTA